MTRWTFRGGRNYRTEEQALHLFDDIFAGRLSEPKS